MGAGRTIAGDNGTDPRVVTGKRSSDYSHFCPEVSYDRFGWFASGLYGHVHELDVDAAHGVLAREGASATDWRWAWADMSPMHYAECPLYSMLDYQTKNAEKSLVDKTIQRLKNRPSISRVVVAGIAVVAAGAAFSGVETIVTVLWRLVSWIGAWWN